MLVFLYIYNLPYIDYRYNYTQMLFFLIHLPPLIYSTFTTTQMLVNIPCIEHLGIDILTTSRDS